jgi:hypothetical protein
LAEGERYDDALQLVYGLNMDSLETAWRTSIGAPARLIPPTLTPIVAAAVPTYPPISAAQDMPTPDTFSGTPFPVIVTPAVTTETVDLTVVETTTEQIIRVTETPLVVAEAVAIEPTVAAATTPAANQPNNLRMWAAIGLLLVAIVGLLVFIFKPRRG